MSKFGNDLNRLRWQCRRGVLELDFVLERYLAEHYAQAAADEQQGFEQLLALDDQTLQRWLILASEQPPAALVQLVGRIRGI